MASGRAFAEGGVVYYMNRAHGTNRTGGPTPQRNRRKRRGGANEALRTMLLIALATLLFIAAAVGIARCSRPDATTVMAPVAADEPHAAGRGEEGLFAPRELSEAERARRRREAFHERATLHIDDDEVTPVDKRPSAKPRRRRGSSQR